MMMTTPVNATTDRTCWAPARHAPVARYVNLQEPCTARRALNFDTATAPTTLSTPPRRRSRVTCPAAPASPSQVYVPDEEDALFTPSRRNVSICPPPPIKRPNTSNQ